VTACNAFDGLRCAGSLQRAALLCARMLPRVLAWRGIKAPSSTPASAIRSMPAACTGAHLYGLQRGRSAPCLLPARAFRLPCRCLVSMNGAGAGGFSARAFSGFSAVPQHRFLRLFTPATYLRDICPFSTLFWRGGGALPFAPALRYTPAFLRLCTM